MVSGSRIEGGTILSARVRKTILSIKEIVGNHSEADIYSTLKETNMDPNETAQKLLNQDPFHEVRRKKDKKKENIVHKNSAEPRKEADNIAEERKFHTNSDRSVRTEYRRNSLPAISREFRVVKDNRYNQNIYRESKDTPMNGQGLYEKGFAGSSSIKKSSGGVQSSQVLNGPTVSQSKNVCDANSNDKDRKKILEKKQAVIPNVVSRGQAVKSNESKLHSVTTASNNSVLGVYSSSSDPVHVPSFNSRSPDVVRAIKREVGVVGVRRLSIDNSVKNSPAPSTTASNSPLGKDVSAQAHVEPVSFISKSDQVNQINVPESVGTNVPVVRTFSSAQYSSRAHKQTAGHQKAAQSGKEWKPKSSIKSTTEAIGIPLKSVSPSADKFKDTKTDEIQLHDKLSRVNIHENNNIIIAQHIRVTENDRYKLTFGSFETDETSKNIASEFQVSGDAEESTPETSSSLLVSASEPMVEDIAGNKQVEVLPDEVIHSGIDSPVSSVELDPELSDKRDTRTQNLGSYADIGLIQENGPLYTTSDSQPRQDTVESSNFPAYDPQTGYNISYFRPLSDEPVCGQDLQCPHESLSSNAIPATIAMVQQQLPSMAQMYPQVHVSHFANILPYRPFLSPVYVPPPMAMPGYSNNPPYPHPSSGSSYLLMPGVNSPHLGANGVKYGIQQFKPLPTGSPTGFASFTSPNGYTITAPGVGNPSGLEDSSRLKYKDGNLYVQNSQGETPDLWVSNPRDISAPYYNMGGQNPHGAYMTSHTFNSGTAQSSHMQFPGLYHPNSQPTNHHLGSPMGPTVISTAAQGTQVCPYQSPPQLGHLNWTPNF